MTKPERDHMNYMKNREKKLERMREYKKENKVAVATKKKEWRKLNANKVAVSNRKAHLKGSYGLTAEQYEDMLCSQDGRCAVCGVKFNTSEKQTTPHVDHSHATGLVRGLLCQHCNFLLGNIKDNPSVLISALRYLEQGDL